MRLSSRSVAQIAIAVQFAALIRCLAELFRLQHALGARLAISQVEPYLLGALITSILAFAAVLFYFAEKHAPVIGISAVNVAMLLALKFLLR